MFLDCICLSSKKRMRVRNVPYRTYKKLDDIARTYATVGTDVSRPRGIIDAGKDAIHRSLQSSHHNKTNNPQH